MGALHTALLENETKAALASMVCDMREDRERLVTLEPVVDFVYDVLSSLKECGSAEEFAHAVTDYAVAAGLIAEVPYDPAEHSPDDDTEPGEVGYQLTDFAVKALGKIV